MIQNLHSEQKKHIKNFSWIMLDNVVKTIGGFLVAIWVQQYLSKSDFGIITLAFAYSGMFTVLVGLGLGHITIREIIRFPKLQRFYLGTVFTIKSAGALLAFLLLNITSYLYEADPMVSFIVFLFSIRLFSDVFNTFNIYFQANVITKYQTISTSISYIISSALKVYFILGEYSVEYFAYAYLADFILAALFKFLFYKSIKSDISQWRFSTKIAKQLLKNSWAVGLTVFLSQIHSNIDKLMIAEMLNNVELGIYGVSTMFSDYSGMLAPMLMAAVLPYLIDLRKNNTEFYRRRFRQILSLVTWSSIIFCILAIAFGENLFSFLYDGKYDNAYEPFVYNIWKFLFLAQMQMINIWLLNLNLQRFQLYTNLAGVFCNILLNYLLITRYGITGAAIATISTRIMINWISPLFFEQTREVTFISLKSLNPMILIRYLLALRQS
jgi:O-antigen/teichoic acid export membrane protein